MPNVNVCPMPKQQFFDGTGAPLAGGKVYTKAADTNNDKATYSDYTGLTENSNPIILDSEGRASIYLEAGEYKFIVNNSDDVPVYTQNGISNSSTAVSVDTVADLKALSVVSVTLIRTLGYSEINDGGEALYYYDPDSELDDNGGSVIVPDTVPSSGRWILVPAGTKGLNVRVFGLACDGSTDDATKLAACSTYCAANDLTMVIDDDVYFASNITLGARIRLLPGVVLTWGSFKPTVDVLIDKGDYTQHFDCTASYVPITTLKSMHPEWFGETISSFPITAAAIAEITITDLLSANIGGSCVTGKLTVGTTVVAPEALYAHVDDGTAYSSTTSNSGNALRLRNINDSDNDGVFTSILMMASGNDGLNNAGSSIVTIQPDHESHQTEVSIVTRGADGDYTEKLKISEDEVSIAKKIDADSFGSDVIDYASTSTVTGWSSFSQKVIRCQKTGKLVHVWFEFRGTSNATSAGFTLPYTPASGCYMDFLFRSVDDGSSGIGIGNMDAGFGSAVYLFSDALGSSWVASGSKYAIGQFSYFTE